MSDQTRELPEQPNLRFLKLEAKRRLAAGEFATLHDAQLAVAREHGLPSWTVLKETVTADQAEPNLALAQVRWLISRFRDSGSTTWVRPADEELREHFTREFLSAVPLDTITDILIRPPLSHEDLVVIEEPASQSVRTQAGGLQVEAFAEADPPHRLTSLQLDRPSAAYGRPRLTWHASAPRGTRCFPPTWPPRRSGPRRRPVAPVPASASAGRCIRTTAWPASSAALPA